MKPGKFAREAKDALFPRGSVEQFSYRLCRYKLSRLTGKTRLERYDTLTKTTSVKKDVPVMRLIALLQARTDQERAGVADEILAFDKQSRIKARITEAK